MKRVLVLVILGVVLAAGLYVWSSSRGGMYKALGVQCTMRWDVSADGTLTREVRISGPISIARFVARAMNLGAQQGWNEAVNSLDGHQAMSFSRAIVHGKEDWQISRLEACQVSDGKAVFREVFLTDMAQRVATGSFDVSFPASQPTTAAIQDGFRKAVKESSARFAMATDQFISGIPATLAIQMPGHIRRAEGATVTKPNNAEYSGTMGSLSGLQITLESDAPGLPGSFRWWHKLGIAALIMAGVVAAYIFWRRCESSRNHTQCDD